MSVYIVKRLLLAIPTLLIVAIIVFFSIRLIPGDVIDLMLAEQYAGATPYDRPRLEHELGLDIPIHIQFGRWLLERTYKELADTQEKKVFYWYQNSLILYITGKELADIQEKKGQATLSTKVACPYRYF